MQKSDALFELIQSLTKGEKRNFKLLTQLTSGDKKYITLFDLMDKQRSYSEKKILRHFKGDPISNQLAVAKNYLYKLILKSLAYYYKQHDAELSTMCFQIKILIEKNLFPHARKMIRKAKLKAERQENFQELLQLLDFERTILKHSNDLKVFQVLIQDIQEKEDEVLGKMENLKTYKHLHDQVYIIQNTIHQLKNQKEEELFNEIREHPLMESEDKALSVRGRVAFLSLRKLDYNFNRNVEAAYLVTRQLVELLETNKEILEDSQEVYIEQLYDLARFLFIKRQNAEAFKALKKLKEYNVRGVKNRIERFEKYSVLRLTKTINMGDVANGLNVAEEIIQGMEKLEAPMKKSRELLLYYFLAYIYFMADMPHEALQWNNKLLNEPRNEIREDLESMARIMNLMIHLELRNYDLLEYRIKNTYRFIYKRNRMNGIQRAIIGFIRRVSLNRGLDEDAGPFLKLQEELQEVVKDPKELRSINVLDIPSWAEAKIRSVSMGQVMMEKYESSVSAIRKREKTGKITNYRFVEGGGLGKTSSN